MNFTIYGIRLRGETEARYIGQTSRSLDARLFNHFSLAKHSVLPAGISRWLLDNRRQVEIFQIAYAETVEEARRIERGTVALCLRLNHRLFNRQYVPHELRLAITHPAPNRSALVRGRNSTVAAVPTPRSNVLSRADL